MTSRSTTERSSFACPTRSRSSGTGTILTATAAKTAGGFIRTGDRGRRDDDGYFWFEGRVDDVISSAGYRIGPEEIEQCLTGHPAVTLAAAIGVPDETRGEIVKAFVVLAGRTYADGRSRGGDPEPRPRRGSRPTSIRGSSSSSTPSR